MKDCVHKKTEGSFVTNGCLFPQQHVEEVLESLYGLVIQVMKKKIAKWEVKHGVWHCNTILLHLGFNPSFS